MKISVVSGAPESRVVDVLAGAVFSGSFATGGAPGTKGKKKGKAQPQRKKADAALALPEPLAGIDDALDGVLSSAAAAEGFKGDAGQTFSLHTHGRIDARRVALVGMGDRERLGPDHLRKLGGAALKAAAQAKAKKLALVVPDVDLLSAEQRVELLAEGVLLAAYRFDRYLSKDKQALTVEEVELVVQDRVRATDAIARARAIAEGVCLARDLVNEPASVVTPRKLAEEAVALGKKTGLKVTVLDEKGIERERMGMVAAVARAASPYNPPRVVKIAYRPAKKAKRKIALVGKGLTFDTGGLDIKPAQGMLDMKIDMSGAAAVIGAMLTVGRLKPDVEVVGYLGCVENGIGGNAYHPGDVLKSRKGLTVEINNTDAEGRLVLADVIDLALTEEKPDVLIDLATLTGACVVALGPTTAGLFTDDDGLAEDIKSSGRRAGEDFWRMPLNDELFSMLKSPIADMKNTGERYGGAITAALFLKQFVDGRATWAHLDIAGPVTTEKDGEYAPKGATGFGVRTLVGLLDPR